MITAKLIVMIVLFIVTGGSLFSEKFKEHKTLAFFAAVFAVASAYYLLQSIYVDFSGGQKQQHDQAAASSEEVVPIDEKASPTQEREIAIQGSEADTSFSPVKHFRASEDLELVSGPKHEGIAPVTFTTSGYLSDLQLLKKSTRFLFADLEGVGLYGNGVRYLPWDLGQSYSVAVSPDETRFVAGGAFGSFRVWNSKSLAVELTVDAHASSIEHVRFSPDGRLLVTASKDDTLKVWDGHTFVKLATLRGHPKANGGTIEAIAFHPSSSMLASSDTSGNVMIWELSQFQEKIRFRPYDGRESVVEHRRRVLSLAFDPSGRVLAIAGRDGSVSVYQTSDWTIEHSVQAPGEGHLREVHFLAFDPLTSRLRFLTQGGEIGSLDLESGNVSYRQPERPGEIVFLGDLGGSIGIASLQNATLFVEGLS